MLWGPCEVKSGSLEQEHCDILVVHLVSRTASKGLTGQWSPLRSVEKLEKEITHILGGMEQDSARFHTPENSTQFKMYELFMEFCNKTADKGWGELLG